MAKLTQLLKHFLSPEGAFLPIETRCILLKEALQAHALGYLYNHPLYRKLNFYGGRCTQVIDNPPTLNIIADVYCVPGRA